jgi:hypothetical protein
MVHLGGNVDKVETDDATWSGGSNCVVGEDNCRTDAETANCTRRVVVVVVVAVVLLLPHKRPVPPPPPGLFCGGVVVDMVRLCSAATTTTLVAGSNTTSNNNTLDYVCVCVEPIRKIHSRWLNVDWLVCNRELIESRTSVENQ